MQYCLVILFFYICVACQQAETAPLVAQDGNSSLWTKNLLAMQCCTQDSCVRDWCFALQPKLPGDNYFFGNLQVNALETGSQKSLHHVYQQIIVPEHHNAFEQTKHLDLSYQNIHFIPNKVTNYPNLMYLSLKSNQIQAINPKLAHCKNLKKIDLSSNGMKSIPFGLIYLTQIDEIVLADNSLSTLPSYFYNLRNLKIIDLSNAHAQLAEYGNDFRELPLVLTKMPNVEKLFLDKLPLNQLPSDLKNMTGLQVLSLNGNTGLNLLQAFDVLATLPNLIALDLSFLGRRTLPPSIAKLKNLKVLLWHEENQKNRNFIEETLKTLLPNTRIYFGEKGVATPFLRGNSVATIRKAGH